jgi:hypothetical protein
MMPPFELYREGLVDEVSVGDELAVFLPEDGAETFCGGFNLLELKSGVVDIRNYTNCSLTRRETCSWSNV